MYKSELKKFAGDKPTPSQRINFHLSRFKPIATNLPFSDERNWFEAIAIKIFNPLLNKKIDRKAVSIIWHFFVNFFCFSKWAILTDKKKVALFVLKTHVFNFSLEHIFDCIFFVLSLLYFSIIPYWWWMNNSKLI
jgi:hypothetical protein